MTLFHREKRTASLSSLVEASRGYRFTNSGQPVDDDSALRLSAVWACVDLIAELVSTLPVDEYRKTPARLVPIDRPVFLDDPSGEGYGFEVWARQHLVSLLLRGNTYGWVERLGEDGWPVQVSSLHPDEITLRRDKLSGPVEWLRDNKPVERWPVGPLWHVPAYPMPGSPVGMSPIRYAAETIGVGLAARTFGAQWFRDGHMPASVLETDQPVTQEQAEALKARVLSVLDGNREPLVLGVGAKMRPISINPNESQFLDTIQANIADVARFYRMPPEMIGGESGASMTYSNVETRSLALLTYTLNGWMVRFERAVSRLRPRGRIVKFNPDALVRVDLMSRYKAHDLAIRSGWRSTNDVRRIEDEAPIPGGNEYLWPPYAVALPEEGDDGDDGPPQPA